MSKNRVSPWASGDWTQRPVAEVVLGVGVLMLQAGGRTDAEVADACQKFFGLGRAWWEDMVPQVRRWAVEAATRPVAELHGLLAYCRDMDVSSDPRQIERYAEALVAMAAGLTAEAEARHWILRDAVEIEARMGKAAGLEKTIDRLERQMRAVADEQAESEEGGVG